MNLKSAKHDNKYANATVTLPYLGDVKFNKDGSIDVDLDGEDLDQFIDATKDSFDFRSKVIKDEGSDNSKSNVTKEQIEQAKEQLQKLTKEQLYSLAIDDLKLNGDDVAKMTDKKIINKIAPLIASLENEK